MSPSARGWGGADITSEGFALPYFITVKVYMSHYKKYPTWLSIKLQNQGTSIHDEHRDTYNACNYFTKTE